MKAKEAREFLGETPLDRLISRHFPTWGSKRLNARLKQKSLHMRAYAAAKHADRSFEWLAEGGDPNVSGGSSLEVLRQRSRQLVRDNEWAKRAPDVITGDTIGTGIRPQVVHKDQKVADDLQALFDAWADSTECDAGGRHTFYGIQRLMLRGVVEAGESLLRFWPRSPSEGLAVPLQLQMMEADHLDTSKSEEASGGSISVQGISLSDYGRREGYWVFPQHPGADSFPLRTHHDSKLVDAHDIVHLYREDRIGQLRGIPWGASCLLRLHLLGEYEDARLMREKVAAAYSVLVRDHNWISSASTNGKEGGFDVPTALTPGGIIRMPGDVEFEFANPPIVQGYSEYMDVSLRAVAAAFGVTPESLTQDQRGSNFTRARVGAIQHFREIEETRALTMIPILCQPVWRRFMTAAILKGVVDEYVPAIWTPLRRDFIDPVREVEGLTKKVQGGFGSLSECILETGRNPERVFDSLERDRDRLKEKGLKVATIEEVIEGS